jgi:hypothetical protein
MVNMLQLVIDKIYEKEDHVQHETLQSWGFGLLPMVMEEDIMSTEKDIHPLCNYGTNYNFADDFDEERMDATYNE